MLHLSWSISMALLTLSRLYSNHHHHHHNLCFQTSLSLSTHQHPVMNLPNAPQIIAAQCPLYLFWIFAPGATSLMISKINSMLSRLLAHMLSTLSVMKVFAMKVVFELGR